MSDEEECVEACVEDCDSCDEPHPCGYHYGVYKQAESVRSLIEELYVEEEHLYGPYASGWNAAFRRVLRRLDGDTGE